jgi:Uma2 family endonuclease
MQTDIPKIGMPELMRFSGARYDQLWQLGVFNNDDRIELLDDQIVRKPEVNSARWHTLYELHKMLLLQLGTRAVVANQSAIRLPQDGRPDPDIVLVRSDLPRQDIPEPSDIYLLIEVADSTLERDRQYKLPLYARDGILEYWIVDIENQQLEVYRDPQFDRYLTSFALKVGQDAVCLAFPDDLVAWYRCLG